MSTLEACRGYEDPQRGDKGEGSVSYNTGHVQGHGTDPQLTLIAARAGINVGSEARNVTISNNTSRTTLTDAYVICTTLNYSPELLSESFGRYCVKIASPDRFFVLVTEKLGFYSQLGQALYGQVTYRERNFKGLEDPPGPLGFVKPPDQYEHQQEFRFLWLPRSPSPLCQFSLLVPAASELCARVA